MPSSFWLDPPMTSLQVAAEAPCLLPASSFSPSIGLTRLGQASRPR